MRVIFVSFHRFHELLAVSLLGVRSVKSVSSIYTMNLVFINGNAKSKLIFTGKTVCQGKNPKKTIGQRATCYTCLSFSITSS